MAAHALIEKLVLSWIHEMSDVQFLTDKCDEFAINVPAPKAASIPYLQKLILRYLTSTELEATPDEGKSVLLKLFSELGLALKKGESPSEPPVKNETDNGSGGVASGSGVSGMGKAVKSEVKIEQPANVTVSPLASLHKIREFKISGSVNEGKEGTLKFVSLSSQITLAKNANYTTPEIIYGVARACPAESNFRTLLESNLDMGMDEFERLLRSHFRLKSSDDILLQLKELGQEPGQSVYEFCCRAISLRNSLAKAAEEEGDPWDAHKLKRRLMRTISTGLKHNSSVKLELQPHLSEDSPLTNLEFLEKVSAAEIHEEERVKKVQEKEAAIALMNAQKAKSDSKNSKNSATAKNSPDLKNDFATCTASVDQLTAKIDQLVTHSDSQNKRIAELEKSLQNLGSSSSRFVPNAPNGRRPIRKCNNCSSQNVPYCSHCWKCNDAGHRAADCPN